MPVVQFAPFASLVQPAFWHELTRLKIDVLRLSQDSRDLAATYSPGRTIRDRETGRDLPLGCNIALGGDAFDEQPACVQSPPVDSADHRCSVSTWSVSARGVLKNYNTIEDFKAADKAALFNTLADEVCPHPDISHATHPMQIWTSVVERKDTSKLNQFLLITFADLKKYQYYYWFAFPAFVAKPAWEIAENGWKPAEEQFSATQVVPCLARVTHLIRTSSSHPSSTHSTPRPNHTLLSHSPTIRHRCTQLTRPRLSSQAMSHTPCVPSPHVLICSSTPRTDHHRVPGSLCCTREPRLASAQPPRIPPRTIPIPHHLRQRLVLARQHPPRVRRVVEIPLWGRVTHPQRQSDNETHRARLGTPSYEQQTQRTHG